MTPEIRPRDMIAIERLIESATAEMPLAWGYSTVLSELHRSLMKLSDLASREIIRRARAERALRYAHKWVGALLIINTILGLAVLVLLSIRS